MESLTFPSSLSRKVGDVPFQIPTTLQPGDTLSFVDALLYNVARATNIAQAFGDRFKKLREEGKSNAEIGEELQAYAKDYVYSPRLDILPPVDRCMIEIAEAELSELVRRKGGSYEAFPRAKREELRDTYLSKNSARLRQEAERRVSSLSEIDIELDLGDIG